MEPEEDSEEGDHDDRGNEVEMHAKEPIHHVVQERIDKAFSGIIENLRVLAPTGPFVQELWHGVVGISPLPAGGVLTIHAHDIGKAFASLNAKIQRHIGRPDPMHAHRFVCFLSDMLAGLLRKAVQCIIQKATTSAMGMVDNLEISIEHLDKLGTYKF